MNTRLPKRYGIKNLPPDKDSAFVRLVWLESNYRRNHANYVKFRELEMNGLMVGWLKSARDRLDRFIQEEKFLLRWLKEEEERELNKKADAWDATYKEWQSEKRTREIARFQQLVKTFESTWLAEIESLLPNQVINPLDLEEMEQKAKLTRKNFEKNGKKSLTHRAYIEGIGTELVITQIKEACYRINNAFRQISREAYWHRARELSALSSEAIA